MKGAASSCAVKPWIELRAGTQESKSADHIFHHAKTKKIYPHIYGVSPHRKYQPISTPRVFWVQFFQKNSCLLVCSLASPTHTWDPVSGISVIVLCYCHINKTPMCFRPAWWTCTTVLGKKQLGSDCVFLSLLSMQSGRSGCVDKQIQCNGKAHTST